MGSCLSLVSLMDANLGLLPPGNLMSYIQIFESLSLQTHSIACDPPSLGNMDGVGQWQFRWDRPLLHNWYKHVRLNTIWQLSLQGFTINSIKCLSPKVKHYYICNIWVMGLICVNYRLVIEYGWIMGEWQVGYEWVLCRICVNYSLVMSELQVGYGWFMGGYRWVLIELNSGLWMSYGWVTSGLWERYCCVMDELCWL
jgi:hypothetical protein